MSRLQSRFSRMTGRASTPQPDFDPYKVLPGLAPALVITLAKLAGSSADDLHVTLPLLPWGDRATLAAYRVIDLDDKADAPRRSLTVRAEMLDLIAAAADVVAQSVDPQAVAQTLARTSPTAAVGEPVPVEVRPVRRADEGRALHGVIEAVHRQADGRRLLRVTVTSDEASATESWLVEPSVDFRADTSTEVQIGMELTNHGRLPRTIYPEPSGTTN